MPSARGTARSAARGLRSSRERVSGGAAVSEQDVITQFNNGRCEKCGGELVESPYVGGNHDPIAECRSCGEHYGCWDQCRCASCVQANREWHRTLAGREPAQHGTYNAYTNYRCRCNLCKKAGSIENYAARQRRLARFAEQTSPLTSAPVAGPL